MKIISIAYPDRSDFAFCIVNDDMADVHYARMKTANHQNIYSLAMFSPDSPGDLLDYVRGENDTAKTETDRDTV
mgnify:CR=1 FL=1